MTKPTGFTTHAALFLAVLAATTTMSDDALAQDGGTLAITTVDDLGDPVPLATITIVSASGYISSTETRLDGSARLSDIVPGSYELRVEAEGRRPRLDIIDITPGTTTRVDWQLASLQPTTLSVTVQDTDGGALPGALVQARGPAGTLMEAAADAAGAVTFTPVRAGRWSVNAAIAGFSPQDAAVTTEFGRTTTAVLTLPLDFEVAETVVVVGSRSSDERSVTASAVPVDVLTAEAISRQPHSNVVDAIRTLAPSFNVNTQPISDAATVVRPANLRNLAPDHTLILVNRKRRHRAAVITWLGNGIADGSQGPDMSVIPAIAVRQVEMLRDGAAAQYGSDAIAGVVNFELKDARDGGSMEFRTGAYQTQNAGDPGTCGGAVAGDIQHSCNGIGGRGQTYSLAANTGLGLGEAGFLNASLEYGNAQPTSRSVQRNDAQRIIDAGNGNIRTPAQVWGSPLVEDDLKLFANFGRVLGNDLQWYGHGNRASRKVTGGFYFRNPHTRSGVFRGPTLDDGDGSLLVGNRGLAAHHERYGTNAGYAGPPCPPIPLTGDRPDAAALAAVEADPNCFTLYSRFPGGFTPQFGGNYTDHSIVTGLRGIAPNGLNWDASVNIGTSEVDQFIYDTVNASLGYDTPTTFRPGTYRQADIDLNFDTSYRVNDVVNAAAGTEWRREEFSIAAGDRASWEIGPYAAQGFSSGSNGFNGYRADTTAGTWARSNVAAYGDLEFTDPAGRWMIGTAGRAEYFDDFGSTLNGKATARLALADDWSLRGAVSTGFRAPTPGQQNAFNVTTAFIGGQLTNQGTVPSTSAVAIARGGGQLEPERSRNYSGGVVFNRGNASFTADFFRIDIRDRLAVSQEVTLSQQEIETLVSEGIAEARNFPVFRFFVNDFSTTTQGMDLIGTWALGRTTLSAVYNFTDTRLKDIENSVINRFRIQTLEEGLPRNRWNIAVTHDRAAWGLTARLNYYGAFWDSEDGRNAADAGDVAFPWLYSAYSGKTLVDVELAVPIGDAARFATGVENLLNTYPDENPYAADNVGNMYGQFSPFGFNGAYYYSRLTYRWGE